MENRGGVDGGGGVDSGYGIGRRGGVVSPCYRSLLLLLLRIAASSTTAASINNNNNNDDDNNSSNKKKEITAGAAADDADDDDDSSSPGTRLVSQGQGLVSAWQGWLLIRAQSTSKSFQTLPVLRHALLTAVQELTHTLAALLDTGRAHILTPNIHPPNTFPLT